METNPAFDYRHGIFNLVFSLKNSLSDNKFAQLIEAIEPNIDSVPYNDLEQSKKFFREITTYIMNELNDNYEVSYEANENAVFHSDVYTLKTNPETVEMIEKYKKYKGMSRFSNDFLQGYNYDLWRRFRSHNHSYNGLSNFTTLDHEGNKVFTTNRIATDADLFLPKDQRGRFYGVRGDTNLFSELYRQIASENDYLENLQRDYEPLNAAIEVFNERIQASLREEHLKFGMSSLKEILSRIVIPVSLIEDEQLRILCEEKGLEVFIKTPTLEDLLYIGSSVHVYSSFEMEDESFVAKPIIISEQLPGDTEELKYLGVGQYTMYNAESSRSLNGTNPYVINNNIFVKASLEDFMNMVPEELVEEMRKCKILLDSLEKPVDSIVWEENETLNDIISTIKEDHTLNPKDVVDNFLATNSLLIQEESRETGPQFIEEERYEFRDCGYILFNHDLLTITEGHPNGYLLFRDNIGSYAAIRVHDDGKKEVYNDEDLDECIRALGLSPGLKTIYDFHKRDRVKREAMYNLHHFSG